MKKKKKKKLENQESFIGILMTTIATYLLWIKKKSETIRLMLDQYLEHKIVTNCDNCGKVITIHC